MDEYTGFGKRDLNAEHHWQNIEARGVLKNHRRKVVIFPGDGTETDRAANGFAKIIDSVFPENEKPEMYSLIYRDNSSCYSHRLYMQANTNHLNDSRYPLGRAPQPYLDTFYQEQILPLISQKDGTERIALEEAAQYLRATTIGTHCHGSTVLLDIENKLKQSMQTLGYSKSEQDFLLKQIVSINFCSSMPLEQTQTSALHIISQADGQAVANWRFGSLNHFIQTKKVRIADKKCQKKHSFRFPFSSYFQPLFQTICGNTCRKQIIEKFMKIQAKNIIKNSKNAANSLIKPKKNSGKL